MYWQYCDLGELIEVLENVNQDLIVEIEVEEMDISEEPCRFFPKVLSICYLDEEDNKNSEDYKETESVFVSWKSNSMELEMICSEKDCSTLKVKSLLEMAKFIVGKYVPFHKGGGYVMDDSCSIYIDFDDSMPTRLLSGAVKIKDNRLILLTTDSSNGRWG
jgi:hypothetical protein